MSMVQLIVGTALGVFLAQGVLYVLRQTLTAMRPAAARGRTVPGTATRGSGVVGGFVRHAALIATGLALVTLGVWAVRDYMAASAARSSTLAGNFDSSAAVPLSDSQAAQDEAATAAPVAVADPVPAESPEAPDPYADPEFQVHRRPHRAGSALSLKETLLQKSEAKARAELLSEIQTHAHRSQYDCEASARAAKYLHDGLDVWGFAAWQAKYFPVADYKGATAPQCQDIANIVDPSLLDLKATVAQEKSPAPKQAVPKL